MTEEMKDQPTPEKEGQTNGGAGEPNHSSPELDPETTTESRLVLARASRTQAENERQNIANEILLSTKDVCEKLISEGESTLAKARRLESKAEEKHLEAISELELANSTREEAVVYADQLVAEAKRENKEADERVVALRHDADTYAEEVTSEAKQQAEEAEVHAASVREEAAAYAEEVKSEAKQQAEEAEAYAALVKEEAGTYAETAKTEAREQVDEAEQLADSVKEAAGAYAEAVMTQAKTHAERVEQQAATVREEADARSQTAIAQAQQQAEEIVELARAAAEQEAAGIRQRSQDEAGETLDEVEIVRAAVQQELEAQQVYTESARATVESLEVLGQIRAKLAEYSLTPGSDQTESTGDTPGLVEEPVDSQDEDSDSAASDPENSHSGSLSDDQLKALLE